MKILVAGIGNIFQGDDAFGCEVVKVLADRHCRTMSLCSTTESGVWT